MRSLLAPLTFAGLAVVVTACGGGGFLDQGKRAPDEFTVYSRAPLSLPPGYALRPPEPGAAAGDPAGPRAEARSALVGGAPAGSGYGPVGDSYAAVPTSADGTDAFWSSPDAASAEASAIGAFYGETPPTGAVAGRGGYAPGGPASPGAEALLARTGGAEADPAIRDFVNRETAILAEEDKSFVERLIFWGTPTEYGTVVDPVEERRRIKENQALGRTVTAGSTPTIERQRRSTFQGLFN